MERVPTRSAIAIALLGSIAMAAPAGAGDARGSGATGGFTSPGAPSQGQRFGPPPPSVTRPAPPLTGHRHPRILLVEPVPYYYPVTAPSVVMTTSDGVRTLVDSPFLCFVEKRGFADRALFTRHLHEAHGVPPESAMALSTVVGGDHIVFFGDSE